MKKEFLQNKFSLLDYYSVMTKENILISYKGPFTDSVLAEITANIRTNLNLYPQVSKKLFAVFIELAQNISYYSSERNYIEGKEDSPGIGTIVIKDEGDFFTLVTGNLINKKNTQHLVEKCKLINSLSRDELREYKRKQRNEPSSEFDGGNIGLIQVALTSNSAINLEIKELSDEYSFIVFAIDLDKGGES